MKCIEEEDQIYRYLEMHIGDHNEWEDILVIRHSRILIATDCLCNPYNLFLTI